MGRLELWEFRSTVLLAGCALDWMFGGPVCIPHLVRLMGRMIARLKLELRRHMRGRELAAGVVLAFTMYAIWWMVPWRLFRLVRSAGFPGSFLSLLCPETFICYQMMAARGLCMESMKVCRSPEDGEVEMARHRVSMIMGRNTSVPDGNGTARAAMETVAENASDGVVAPFLFMALSGPAGGTFYKAVSTMDSMIGYKNDTYRFFGRTTALLDDVLNPILTRVTGCFMVLAIFLIPGMDGMNGQRIFLRDRKKYASPNPAHGEAACAEILHLRLAGDVRYSGSLHRKPFIGEDDRPVVSADIRRANQLMSTAQEISATMLAAILAAV